MIVTRFTFFTENLVICSYQVTKNVRSGHDSANTSSARRPRYLCLQADIAIWVREVIVDTVLARARFHFCSRLHLVIHEKNWKCLDPQAQGFSVALQEQFH